jgi:SAM-dependent methyltransferase
MQLNFDVKNSREIIFRGHVVMSRSEEPYLRALIGLFAGNKIESVLEVGYGLGISAALIQEMLQPSVHHIVEIEQAILRDCRHFCLRHAGARAIEGDYAEADYPQRYDLLFFDPYDYELALNRVTARQSYVREFNREVSLAHRVLRPGGLLCHVLFGDCPVPELDGFTYLDRGFFTGASITIAAGQPCAQARLGMYVLKSAQS